MVFLCKGERGMGVFVTVKIWWHNYNGDIFNFIFEAFAEQVTRFSMAKGLLVFMELVGTSCWYKLTPVLSCFVFTIPQILVLEQMITVNSY